MDELVEFLRARLDEDERQQRDPFEQWHHKDCESLPQEDYPTFECNCGVPARVLREIEAKRRLITEVIAYEEKIDSEWGCGHDADQIAAGRCPMAQPQDMLALRLLALPYTDHPDYREEWRP